jgi:predicted RNA-binding protein Jag
MKLHDKMEKVGWTKFKIQCNIENKLSNSLNYFNISKKKIQKIIENIEEQKDVQLEESNEIFLKLEEIFNKKIPSFVEHLVNPEKFETTISTEKLEFQNLKTNFENAFVKEGSSRIKN